MEKVIAFDIWGDYAHFKKFHTTASPLTFSIPPPTAVMGMLGAILGLKPGEYQRELNGRVKISIKVMSELKKTRMGVNWIDTKTAMQLNRIKNRTQILVEYLRNPNYRVYIYSVDSDLHGRLKLMLSQHISIYTLYLGITECIASFSYFGEFDAYSGKEELSAISSVIPMDIFAEVQNPIKFEPSRKYVRERMPIKMDENRKVELYQDVIIETTGQAILCKPKEYMELSNGERLIFF
jgi:CRISPR-associated protein Cas5h